MSSLIELIEFDSKNNSKSSSKPINSNGIYSSNEARTISKNSSIHTPFPFSQTPLIALTPSQGESKPSQKNKRHIGGGATAPNYINTSKTNFNFASSPQRDENELASPIIWNKLNKALNNTYIIDTNTRDKDANDNQLNFNVNSNKNSINSINTLNRNDEFKSTTNLNQQTSEKSDIVAAAGVDRKSLSYLNANDEMNSITNLNNISNSINTNNTYTSNINQQEAAMFSTLGQRRFCACCCCFNANEKGNISNNKNPLSNSDTFRMLTFHLKRILSNFKVNMLGLLLSTVISFTFVIMTYTLRNSLNLIELSKAYAPQKDKVTNNETLIFLNRTFTFNIEYKYKRVDSNCDFCFLIVWAATSSLTLIYPVFFLFVCRTYKKKTKSSRLIEAASISKASQDNLVPTSHDENASKPLRRRKRVKSPYLLLLSESLKIFNTKKKRCDANTISNNVSNGTNGKNDVNNFDHLKLKRYLFLKILAVTFLWILTGYTYIRAIHLLYCSEVIILFSVNFAFVFITSWIILHNKFIPIRVRF
jgi:hypothetical protein